MSMFTLRRSQKQSGFTLMELLIVIAVLGLLLGMLIPRLAGITDDTVDTVCDTNNKGIRYYTQAYYNKTGGMPDGLTNLVDYSNDGGGYVVYDGDGSTELYTTPAYMPTFQDDNDANDLAEVLAEEFYTRNMPGGYVLGSNEVAELKSMGLTTVYNLIGGYGSGSANTTRSMMKETLEAGCAVMMMGVTDTTGGNTSTAVLNFSSTDAVGNPEWIGRIMMAVNDKCDLVKGGYIQASALCPGAVLAEDSFTHKEYIIVLPRLEATVEKLTEISGDFEFYDASTLESGLSGTNIDSATLNEFTFEAQEAWNFDMSCPEGHKWPDNDEDSFYYSAGTGIGSSAYGASS